MGWDDEKRARRAQKEIKALARKAKMNDGELPSREKSRLKKIAGIADKASYNPYHDYREDNQEYSDWD